MTAAPGIVTSGTGPPNATVVVQPGMNVQPVVLVDQNGQFVTTSGSTATAGYLADLTGTVNVSGATAPTAGQVLTATGGSAATWQSPWQQAQPAGYTPAGTVSTLSGTAVMMGLGTACTYTPAGSGKVLSAASGVWTTLTGAANITLHGRYGAGTAPAGGSASTGTPWGYGASDPVLAAPSAITGSSPWAFQQLLSLTPDTAYWFDLAVSTKNTSDAAEVANISMTFAELP